MDVLQVVNTQYAFPIGVVLIVALLVFTFGFRAAEQPAFYRLTDDRKPAGKKRKPKDKKTQPNGHATTIGNEDHYEKQKSVENNVSKSTAGKSVSKHLKEVKNELDKSPSKNISSKLQTKQTKPKQENFPLKENTHKSVAKESARTVTSKNPKEKKETAELDPKLLKEMKQATTDKPPVKEKNNKTQQKSNKGKENKVEEIKNKKNEKNLAKLKKSEEKPVDFDEGEWEKAVSRKDKKNRKKDDDNVTEKTEKKESASPSKKKKSKTVESIITEESVVEENKAEKEDVKESKSSKPKDKSSEEKVSEKTVPVENDIEITLTEKKSVEEVNASPDQSGKSKKKKKKSNKASESDVTDNDKVESLPAVATSQPQTPVKSNTSPKSVTVEIKENTSVAKEGKPKSETQKVETKTEPETSVAFDELGDVWKEAKMPKKSKKKVRKDQ